MKKGLIASLVILLGGSILALLLLFKGNFGQFRDWWLRYSHDSTSLPGSPYNSRVADPESLLRKEATKVIFLDSNLFWKGSGATVGPEVNESGDVVSLVVTSEGSGYMPGTIAKVVGAGAEGFELGKVTVRDGKVKAVELIRAGTWFRTPRLYARDDETGQVEELPFSGTVELKFDGGQVHERKQYLVGELHGEWERFLRDGRRVYLREYAHGQRHGTHTYWFDEPIDPEDYNSAGDAKPGTQTYASLWIEVHEDARRKFPKHPSPKSNEWAVKQYESRGGSFQVELLEHYEKDEPHGLFEGFDRLGNKTFKDEYDHGLRISHKTYDKTKKG